MDSLLEARLEYTYKAKEEEISNVLLVFNRSHGEFFVIEHHHAHDENFVGAKAYLKEAVVTEVGLPRYLVNFWKRCLKTENSIETDHRVSPGTNYQMTRKFEFSNKGLREKVLDLIKEVE